MKISLIRKSVPVALEFDAGVELQYSVREMSGAQRDKYFSLMQSKTAFDEQGEVTGVKEFSGIYSTLLALTVYDDKVTLVKESIIQEWPDAAQKAQIGRAHV